MSDDEVTNKATNANLPILFLDTCALLDLMRGPNRKEFDIANAKAAIKLLGLADNEKPEITLMLADQVINELNDNMGKIKQYCSNAILDIKENMQRLFSLAKIYGIDVPYDNIDITALKFDEVANGIVDCFIRASLKIFRNDTVLTKATKRVLCPKAPAKKGKDSLKDCIIIETYLHTANNLRMNGFQNKIVFLTVNTKDFSEIKNNSFILHKELSTEFSDVSLEFAVEFQHASSLLYNINSPKGLANTYFTKQEVQQEVH